MSKSLPALTFTEGGWCEELNASYHPGIYIPKTREEYTALAPFASGPVVEIEDDEDDKAKAAIVEEALALKVLDKNGKPIAKSVLERFASDRIVALVVEAKAKAEAKPPVEPEA